MLAVAAIDVSGLPSVQSVVRRPVTLLYRRGACLRAEVDTDYRQVPDEADQSRKRERKGKVLEFPFAVELAAKLSTSAHSAKTSAPCIFPFQGIVKLGSHFVVFQLRVNEQVTRRIH